MSGGGVTLFGHSVHRPKTTIVPAADRSSATISGRISIVTGYPRDQYVIMTSFANFVPPHRCYYYCSRVVHSISHGDRHRCSLHQFCWCRWLEIL